MICSDDLKIYFFGKIMKFSRSIKVQSFTCYLALPSEPVGVCLHSRARESAIRTLKWQPSSPTCVQVQVQVQVLRLRRGTIRRFNAMLLLL